MDSIDTMIINLPCGTKHLFKKLCVTEDYHYDLGDVEEFLDRQLSKNPYPTLQILKYHSTFKINLLADIVFSGLIKFAEDKQLNSNDVFFEKFLNFVANFYFEDEQVELICEALMKVTFKLSLERRYILFLAFLAHSRLLSTISCFESENISLSFGAAILHHTLQEEIHIIQMLINFDLSFSMLNVRCGQYISISKLAQQLCIANQSIKQQFLFSEEMLLTIESTDKSSHLFWILYIDLKRMANIFAMLKKYVRYELPLASIISTQSILDLIFKKTKFTSMGFEIACDFVIKNHVLYNQMLETNNVNTELQILVAYHTLATVCDIYFKTKRGLHYAKAIEGRLCTITDSIRSIEDNQVLAKLLENILRLIFLRWEGVEESLGSDDIIDEFIFDVSRDSGRGFVCNQFVLEKLLNVVHNVTEVRMSVTKLENNIQGMFKYITYAVDDACWRMQFLQKNQTEVTSTKISIYIDVELIPSLLVFHGELLEQRSSDDDQPDEAGTINILPKKKSKMKKRRNSVPAVLLENYRLVPSVIKDINGGKATEDEGIVARMLGNPRDLALIALSREDIDSAKEITQKFNIKDLTLERNISFLENMRYIKSQLEKAIVCYEEQESYLKSQSTIEHIRKVAAIGFETSRITNIIEEFSHANHIVTDPESSAIVEKFHASFPFFCQYRDDNLQLCIILDLILNLNMNHELSSNLWNMANRLYATGNLLEDLNSHHELYRGVGSVYYFNNIVQSMHLFKTISRENLGAKDMICNTFFTLRGDTLKGELGKEIAFKLLFKVQLSEIDSMTKLKGLAKSFHELKGKINYYVRFVRYISNLIKALDLINSEKAKHNISETLTVNIRQTIGKILFENEISLGHIENLVLSMNLNFVHTIALNICSTPMVASQGSVNTIVYKFVDKRICSYVSRCNPLLSYILEQITEEKVDSHFMSSDYFINAVKLPEVESYAAIYDGNIAISALLFDHLFLETLKTLESEENLIAIYKCGREKFNRLLEFSALKDNAINKLIQTDISNIELVDEISEINSRADILLKNIVQIKNSDLALSIIQSVLFDDNIDYVHRNVKSQLLGFQKDIKIFSEAASDFLFETWGGAYIFGKNSPELIMKELVRLHKYELCCDWWKLHCKTINLSMNSFRGEFFNSLIETENKLNPHLIKIVESFPASDVAVFFEANIERFKNLSILKYVISYLIEQSSTKLDKANNCIKESNLNAAKYQNYLVSLNIFDYMSSEEREQNWSLFSRPLLIIEQFVMNSKFEILLKILSSIRALLGLLESCKYCNNNMNKIYEIPMNSSITLGNPKNSAFILLNFNLYQNDHIITTSCIDTLLQIYATKALDYRINEKSNSNDPSSLSTEMNSLDSLYGVFVMPKDAPTKENWIKDYDTMQCMCCKRATFTMLTRRHHCRRCGRVICYSCSTSRMKIPQMYEDILVRVCNDCLAQTHALAAKTAEKTNLNPKTMEPKKKKNGNYWQLSGNLTHDKLLREEFSYEHAPSSHLCLSILSFHSNTAGYVNLVLHHCRKFEKLLKPLCEGYLNPEIDYALVSKMLNCLALAAKVRGGPPECDVIRDHSEIILSVVQNNCEVLLPTVTINNQSLRTLGNAVMLAEKWHLALDIYLKCGHSTAAVMGAYGLACLRVGRYHTAREQFCHCMTRLCKAHNVVNILKFITTEYDLDVHSEIDIPTIKRTHRSPPILDQIIKAIESTSKQAHMPETLAKTDSVRNSNSSLASKISKLRDKIPILEPAINIINTISTLKKISQGIYCDSINRKNVDNKASVLKKTQMFEECLYYLFSYGTHVDIVKFLIRHDQTMYALRYFILQNLENDIFTKHIYVKHLKSGRVDYLMQQMAKIDTRLSIWKEAIIQTCRYLETKNLLNSLYHLQILLDDPIRASMTCVKFYSMNCSNFRELQNNSFHLINAQKHLQSELEVCQWENINLEKQRPVKEPSFLMKMDAKTLNCHINTILRQMEVTKFLAKAEQDEKSRRSTRQILKQIGVEMGSVPTLFDSMQERIQICILVLLCGNNIEEGFGLAYRIIQDYNLPSGKIYTTTAKNLARNNRLEGVRSLINCIKSNNGSDPFECDKIISLSVNAAMNTHLPETKVLLDELIKMITDISTKISCQIYVGQLKSAYLLAVQHNRLNDIMKIFNQAEAAKQIHIVRLCAKKLNLNSR